MTLPLLAAVTAVIATFPADAPKPPAGTAIAGVGIVSPDATAAYVPAKGGGVEALDLATGKVLWSNADAYKLAGASGGKVIGWVGDPQKLNAFRVVVIEAATGKTVAKSEPVELPEWAVTAREWGRTFRIAALAEADPVRVVWQANAYYAGGARPTREIEEAARKEASGVVNVDLRTGKLTVVDRKPRPEEFNAGPDGAPAVKPGGYEFTLTETPPKLKPGVEMVTAVKLTVLKDGKELWSRELAGNPWSPPRP